MARPYQAVLFDVDGTLVDSNDLHARCWVEAFRRGGHEVAYDRVRPLIGKGGDRLITETTGLADDDPRHHELAEARTELFLAEYAPQIRALPGARDLLVQLDRDGYVIAIATSAREPEMHAILRAAGLWEGLFDTRTTSNDAEHTKPAPDIIEAAVARAGHPASACIMIGDTPWDLIASRRAGVDFLGVRSGGWHDADFDGALAVYDHPGDLLAQLPGSALAR